MKKLLLIAAIALGCSNASAQQTLNLSTYAGTDLVKYNKKTLNVNVNRYVFNGWNTISLPFDLSEEQINEVFGTDCRLETLAGVEKDGSDYKLNFLDCKKEGIKANTPYILYYTGETGSKTIKAKDAYITDEPATKTFNIDGIDVKFECAQKQTEAKGRYGILAKDNSEASFVNVDDVKAGFYATRCYVSVSNSNIASLETNHIGSGDVTSISSVSDLKGKGDIYNLSGIKVGSKGSALTPGIYIINNKKVLVK